MKYEILKNYLLMKMEKDTYINKEEIKIVIDAIEKATEEVNTICLKISSTEEEK
jgi:hypothetical protein